MKRLRIGLIGLSVVGALASFPANAAPPPNINNTVGVCDPNAPTSCLAPSSIGGLPTFNAGYTHQTDVSNVSVGTTATLVAAARTGSFGTGRGLLILVNPGTTQMACSSDSSVTTTKGIFLAPVQGASITIPYNGAEYCVGASATTLSVTEIY
jgi:hypothetical protein